MSKRIRVRNIVLGLFCAVFITGCGKSDELAWVENTEPLQRWYEEVSSDAAEVNSLQEHVDLFLACHDEELDYGLAYAVTVALCEELELCEVATDLSDEELAEYFSDAEQLYLLDFTMPMFETYYFDEDTTKYVEAAAISFARYISEQGALENVYQNFVTDANEDIVGWKNNWLSSIGVEETYEPFAVLHFADNNRKDLKDYPYVLSDTEANWYFHPDDVKEYSYKSFMEEYLIVEELMVLDFPEVRAIFEKYLPEDVPRVDIRTKFYDKSSGLSGYYQPGLNCITLYVDWERAKGSLVHEYVHYLTMGETKLTYVGTVAEGMAEEVSIWGCQNRLAILFFNNYYGEEEIRETIFWNEEIGGLNNGDFTNWIAYNYYIGALAGTSYFTVAEHTSVRPEKIQFAGELSYYEMASITHYLIELYGRDEVYANYYNYDSFLAFIGGDFLDFYEDWAEWNKEQCRSIGIQLPEE